MLRTESTTDSPADVKAAYDLIGQPVEITTFEDGITPSPNPDETPAPDQTGAAPETPTDTGAPETPVAEPPAAPTPENEEDLEAAMLDETLPKGVRQRIQKILGKATRTRYEAEALLATAKAAKPPEPAAPAKTPEPEPVVVAPPVVEPPEPTLEDFLEKDDPQAEYVKALTDYRVKKAVAQATADLEAKLQRKEETAIADADAQDWYSAVNEEGRKSHADWDAIAKDPEAQKVTFSPAVHLALNETGDPAVTADIVHYLTTHRDEAKRIFEATTHDAKAQPLEILRKNRIAAVELARIQGLATRTPAAAAPPVAEPPSPAAPPKPAKVTAAPPPIKPVHGAAPSTTPNPYDTSKVMDYRQYMAWKRANNLKV